MRKKTAKSTGFEPQLIVHTLTIIDLRSSTLNVGINMPVPSVVRIVSFIPDQFVNPVRQVGVVQELFSGSEAGAAKPKRCAPCWTPAYEGPAPT